MWDEMDDEKKEKMKEMMAEKFKELGLDESKFDEHLMHSFKKVYFKLMKLRFHLDKAGVSEAKTKEIFEKMIDMVMKKDLEKMKAWHEEHPHEEHHHHHEDKEEEEED